MRKGDQVLVESISSKLSVLISKYKTLVDGGCNEACGECSLSRVVIKEQSFPYEYSGCKIFGRMTICDLLGILLVKGKDALPSH